MFFVVGEVDPTLRRVLYTSNSIEPYSNPMEDPNHLLPLALHPIPWLLPPGRLGIPLHPLLRP